MPNLTLARLPEIEALEVFITTEEVCRWNSDCHKAVKCVPALTREVRRLLEEIDKLKAKAESQPDLLAACRAIKKHEGDCLRRGIGYDAIVARIARDALDEHKAAIKGAGE